VTDLRAVVFDWRGTLVTTLTADEWVGEALALLGRSQDGDTVAQVLTAIAHADGEPSRLEADGVDCDARRHRATYYAVFADAGLDDDLSDALYAVESDPTHNHYADDVAETLRWVTNRGCKVAILSDIHFDLRPVFVAAGLDRFVDGYVLSFECGVQKPDAAIFRAALDALGSHPERTLMVGDRASHDGAAVGLGMPTLLVPTLTHPAQRRLDLVRNLVGP
jgi:putative hydrolase of the HAD superfamily